MGISPISKGVGALVRVLLGLGVLSWAAAGAALTSGATLCATSMKK